MNISVAMTFAEGGMVMAYWKEREKKISIFEQTILLCESNPALLDKVMRARENSVLYHAQEGMEGQWKREQRVTDIVVTEHRALEAVRNWKMQYPDSRVGVLNFAAPMHPGGDVIRGSDTQEAGICRCSTLYPCLHTERWMQQYYGENRRMPEAGYGNSCIYIPDVIGVRQDAEFPVLLPEQEWYAFDVISCAAGKVDVYNKKSEEDCQRGQAESEQLERQIEMILQIAARQQINILVLGAFGCGRAGNEPEMVAHTFKKALNAHCHTFRAIEFAIYSSKEKNMNYDIFSAVL